MPFGAHETMEVHEVLNEKINMINHFILYAQHCQEPFIRSMIDRHLQAAMQHYDQLVAYTHDYSAAQGASFAPNNTMQDVSYKQIQYGLHQPAPVGPQLQGRLNDQQILSAMLCAHKNSAKNQTIALLECADPNIRQMLQISATAAANHAYEVFLFMNRMGQYQVPTMHDHTAKTFLHAYQPSQQALQPQFPGQYQ